MTPGCCLQGDDEGTTLLPVLGYLEARDGEKPVGVYAIYDEKQVLQYVGYTRNIVLAVKVSGHEAVKCSPWHLASSWPSASCPPLIKISNSFRAT